MPSPFFALFARPLAAALAAALALVAPAARAADDDPWLGRDKFDHFVVTTSIAAEGYVIAVNHVPARWHALVIAGGVSLAIGAAKEGWDALGHGTPSWRDLAWDAIGTAAGLGVAWGIDLILRGVDEEHPLLRAPVVRF